MAYPGIQKMELEFAVASKILRHESKLLKSLPFRNYQSGKRRKETQYETKASV